MAEQTTLLPARVGPVFRRISTWDPGFVAAIRRHYPGSTGPPPGKKMAWEVLEEDPWFWVVRLLGWVGLGEPAYKLAARRMLGLADARPLPRTVCCFMFRMEERSPRFEASRVLRDWRRTAAAAWQARYGWEPEHWETLVDPAEVRGTVPGYCFRRAGWRRVGETTGKGARRPPGSSHGARVWGPASVKVMLYAGPLARCSAEGRRPC